MSPKPADGKPIPPSPSLTLYLLGMKTSSEFAKPELPSAPIQPQPQSGGLFDELVWLAKAAALCYLVPPAKELVLLNSPFLAHLNNLVPYFWLPLTVIIGLCYWAALAFVISVTVGLWRGVVLLLKLPLVLAWVGIRRLANRGKQQ